MSNNERLIKCQTCVLRVSIHCEGCKKKVKKILKQIDEVYTTIIDPEDMRKVTVIGNVDAETLIKKLAKKGKRAEIWPGESNPNNNDNKIDKRAEIWGESNPNNNYNKKDKRPEIWGGSNPNNNHNKKDKRPEIWGGSNPNNSDKNLDSTTTQFENFQMTNDNGRESGNGNQNPRMSMPKNHNQIYVAGYNEESNDDVADDEKSNDDVADDEKSNDDDDHEDVAGDEESNDDVAGDEESNDDDHEDVDDMRRVEGSSHG